MLNRKEIRQREKETKYRTWSPELMAAAIAAVQEGRLSLRQASAQFGVSKSSLYQRVSGKVAFGNLYGMKPLLSPADEDTMVMFCRYCAEHGFLLTKPQVEDSALRLYNQCNPKNPKKTLGSTWWINFRERYHEQLTTPIPDVIELEPRIPDVIELEPETSDVQRKAKCVKREPIEDYFRLLCNTIDELQLNKRPQQIYCCGVTTFPLGNRKRKIDVRKNSKEQTPYTKDEVTVLACFNAAGEDVPPFLIYKGDLPNKPYSKEGVPNALYVKSRDGNIDGELFRKWFIKHFFKYATKERPLLLIMDGHHFYFGPQLALGAQREDIIFLGLPPHSSHLLQPLDEHFFGPLKANIPGDTTDFRQHTVNRNTFSPFLKQWYQKVKDHGDVLTGFRRCGLYPLDPEAIDWSKVTPPGPPQRNSPAPVVLLCFDVQVKSEESLLPDVEIRWSPESDLKQEIQETPQIKEEPEEQVSVKQEEEPMTNNIIITNVVSLHEKNNQRESETDEEMDDSSATDDDENCGPAVKLSAPQMRAQINGDKDTKTQEVEIEGQYECNICKEEFSAPCGLAMHMKTHTGIKPYSCPHCHRTFEHNSGLKKHQVVHSRQNHKCPDCGLVFPRSRLLDAHMSVHTGIRPFKCSECGKDFNQKRYLDNHMKTHLGEKPFICSICSKAFGRKGNLQKHEIIHQRDKK